MVDEDSTGGQTQTHREKKMMRVVKVFVVDLHDNSDDDDVEAFLADYNGSVWSRCDNGNDSDGCVVDGIVANEKRLEADKAVKSFNDWWGLGEPLTRDEKNAMDDLEIEPDAWSVSNDQADPIWSSEERANTAVAKILDAMKKDTKKEKSS